MICCSYQETKNLIERALQGDHEVTPKIRNVLANMYCDRGDLFEAENLYRQILIDLKETPPSKDPNEHLHSTRLGVFYWTQDDKLNASGTKMEGVHTGDPGDFSAFDPWFVSALSTKNGLAIAHMKEGRLSTAETLFKQALEGREKASGFEDRKTLEIVNHLGALEVLKGDFIAAERLLLRALDGIEKRYGPVSARTQMIFCNLGLCYLESAQYNKAEHYLSRAARNLEDSLGPTHPFTLTTFHNQGLLHLKQHNFSVAEAKFQRAIEGWQAQASGEGGAKSEGDSKYCLATIYETLKGGDKRVEAVALLRETETLYEQALGKTHPQTLEAGKKADQVWNLVKIAGMKVV